MPETRASRMALAAPWITAVTGIVGVIIGAVITAAFNLYIQGNVANVNYQQAGGRDCINFEAWVIDRIRDGMTDSAIADLAYVAEQAGTSTQAATIYPTAPVSGGGGPSPYVSSVVRTYYYPCTTGGEAGILALVARIRGDLPRAAPARPSPSHS